MSKDRNKTIRKSLELDTDLDVWYKEHYPGTSLWWFINSLMRAFKDLHSPEQNNLLDAPMKEAASEVWPDK